MSTPIKQKRYNVNCIYKVNGILKKKRISNHHTLEKAKEKIVFLNNRHREKKNSKLYSSTHNNSTWLPIYYEIKYGHNIIKFKP